MASYSCVGNSKMMNEKNYIESEGLISSPGLELYQLWLKWFFVLDFRPELGPRMLDESDDVYFMRIFRFVYSYKLDSKYRLSIVADEYKKSYLFQKFYEIENLESLRMCNTPQDIRRYMNYADEMKLAIAIYIDYYNLCFLEPDQKFLLQMSPLLKIENEDFMISASRHMINSGIKLRILEKDFIFDSMLAKNYYFTYLNKTDFD